MKKLFTVALIAASFAVQACPEGKWPRNQSTATGGGLSTSTGGGMSTYTGGGLSTYTGGGMSTYTGGGLSTYTGGGLSTSTGGGLSTNSDGADTYCSNIPPWPVFVEYLENNGYKHEAKTIRDAFRAAGLKL